MPKAIDIWLVRLSYIAQIAGVGLALFGLYFTVIPLYQKAAVDEQLARREAELRLVENRLVIARREAYELRRASQMVRFLFATDDCAELRKVIGQVSLDVPKEKRREVVLNFDVDIPACLLGKVSELRDQNILLAQDIAVLEKNAASLGRDLMAEREKVVVKIAALPESARADRSLLDPPGPFVARADAQIDLWDARLPPHLRKDRTAERLAKQIEWTQESMAQRFRQYSSQRMRKEIVPGEWRTVKAPADQSEPR